MDINSHTAIWNFISNLSVFFFLTWSFWPKFSTAPATHSEEVIPATYFLLSYHSYESLVRLPLPLKSLLPIFATALIIELNCVWLISSCLSFQTTLKHCTFKTLWSAIWCYSELFHRWMQSIILFGSSILVTVLPPPPNFMTLRNLLCFFVTWFLHFFK